MTLQYYSSKRIEGLSSDTKPTTAQDDSVFFETDTGKFFDFDLSSTTWTERATASEGETGGQLNLPYNTTLADYNTHTTSGVSSEGLGDSETNTWGETGETTFTLGWRDYNYHPCGSYQVDGGNPVDATNVVVEMRVYGYINWAYMKIEEVTSSGTTIAGESGQYGSAGTYTLNRGTVNDLIGYNFHMRCAGTNNSNPIFNIYARGKSLNADFATTKLKTYSTDSDDATWWQSNQETNPYIWIDTGSLNRIDSVMIKPKDTTTETEIAIQTATATGEAFHEDDFSSDKGWTNTSFTGVSSGVLTGNLNRSSTNHGSVFDLGSAVSDSEWIMRFKLNITTKATAENNSIALYLSDSQLVGINANKSAIGIGLSQYNNSFKAVAPYNTYSTGNDSNFGTPDVGTYYIEVKRTSTTKATYTIYSDSNYSTQVAQVADHTINASITGLRYLVVQGMNDNGSGGTWTIEIDDILIHDDASEITVGDWTTVRTVTTSNLTNGSYNYIRINPTTARYVRIYGNSGNSLKMAISELKVKNGLSDNDFLLAHGHGIISTTDTSIGLDGT